MDFVKGFYVTPIRDQAVKWAARFKRHGGKGVVSQYNFNIKKVKEDYRVLKFERYTEEWLVFMESEEI